MARTAHDSVRPMRFLLVLLLTGCGGDDAPPPPGPRVADPAPMLGDVGEDDDEEFPFVGIPIPGPDGPFEAKSAQGTVIIRGQYVGGQPDGDWRGYFDDGGKKVRGRFVAGVQDGEWTTWWPSGKLREVGSYAAGEAVGTWRLWYPNGQLFETMEQVAGKPHGPWTIHWDNGVAADVMQYAHGAQVGLEVNHDRAGTKVAEGGFDANQPAGTWRCFEGDAVREVPAPTKRITPREACGLGAPPDLPDD